MTIFGDGLQTPSSHVDDVAPLIAHSPFVPAINQVFNVELIHLIQFSVSRGNCRSI